MHIMPPRTIAESEEKGMESIEESKHRARDVEEDKQSSRSKDNEKPNTL